MLDPLSSRTEFCKLIKVAWTAIYTYQITSPKVKCPKFMEVKLFYSARKPFCDNICQVSIQSGHFLCFSLFFENYLKCLMKIIFIPRGNVLCNPNLVRWFVTTIAKFSRWLFPIKCFIFEKNHFLIPKFRHIFKHL